MKRYTQKKKIYVREEAVNEFNNESYSNRKTETFNSLDFKLKSIYSLKPRQRKDNLVIFIVIVIDR